jgi:hypothetical protein
MLGFLEERQKYGSICQTTICFFSLRLRTVIMRHDCVEQHIKVCNLLSAIYIGEFIIDHILNYFLYEFPVDVKEMSYFLSMQKIFRDTEWRVVIVEDNESELRS